MKYIDTSTFKSILAPVDAAINDLEARLDYLRQEVVTREEANLTKPKSRKAPVQKLKNHIASLEKSLIRRRVERASLLSDVSPKSFTMKLAFDILIEAEGGVWTPEQRALGAKKLANYEGRFEEALRIRMGWPAGASLGTSDFPDGGEGKYLGACLEPFRAGREGRRAWGRLYRELARVVSEESLTLEQWDKLADGEISAGKLYHTLPELIRQQITHALTPSRVLSDYKTIYLMTDYGYLVVPSSDYDRAFILATVTQASPKYRIRRDYLEKRLLASLVEEQQNVGPEHALSTELLPAASLLRKKAS